MTFTNQMRYLGDAGVSTGDPLFIPVFHLTVPAGATIALVVFNVSGFPAGDGATYELLLDPDIFCQQASPTPTGTPNPSATITPTCPRPTPGACTSYEAELTQNTLEGSAIVLNCPTCSNGAKVGYVGSNDGTLQFNAVGVVASGNYTVTICYLNGDAVRYALLSVNGGPGTPVSFPSTASFETLGSIQITVTLNTGCNTLKFYNPIVGSWAPDFDRIQFNCPTCAVLTPTPTPLPTPAAAPAARAQVADFNGDSHPDFVVQNPSTHQTAIVYLNNNVVIGAAFGPTLPVVWRLRGVADFNIDSHPDYGLFKSDTAETALAYLSGPTLTNAALGPTFPGGWELVATADLNGDAYPDYVLYKTSTRQTVIAYLNNNVVIGAAFGPTLPSGWSLIRAADFNGDGHPDYALFNSNTRQTLIGYLSGPTVIGAAFGPTIPTASALVAAADFDGDGEPDYLLYNAGTRQTAIWYLNNNVFVSAAFGPTLPIGWSLADH